MIGERASGILLHPTSLPGPHGIGDLGPAAHRFVDFLASSRQRLWQILPLGPTGFGDSPYAARSAFAGNPLLISLELLAEDGLLGRGDLADVPVREAGPVDYGAARAAKMPALRRAFAEIGRAPASLRSGLATFREAHRDWLANYALFAALRAASGGKPWTEWAPGLAWREPSALAKAEAALSEEVHFNAFLQFLFFRQWSALRAHAHERGIGIVGDMPIFVAHDSADVWAHPELFLLRPDGRPAVVAGVPPDYFSETGQRWGNPIYDWRTMAAAGFRWWIDRVRGALEQVDALRLDHFRGFQAYWEVPASEKTAVNGRWVRGPGRAVFDALREALGELSLVAEDLGLITPEVDALREELGLPGMKVLQFAFGAGSDSPHLPYNYQRNCVVYTGTHDNDTVRGWYSAAGSDMQHAVRLYLGTDGSDVAWDLIRLAYASVADWAIAPLQDALDLGGEARMNTPGRLGGNWAWRCEAWQLGDAVAERLAGLVETYGRLPSRKSAG